MKIQINTDRHIKGTEKLEAFVSGKIRTSLKRFADQTTRIEVHLSDQNADKQGSDDIQCKIEARLEKLQPIIVTARNSTKETAINDAIDKLKSALDKVTGKSKRK